MYSITQEEMDRIIAYLNGQDPDLVHTDIPKKIMLISYDLQKAVAKDLSRMRRENETLRKRVDRLTEKREQDYAAGEFTDHEAGFHDTDIAKFVIYYLKSLNARYRMEEVIFTVYLTYAVFLTQGVRLTIEHPVASDKGPWFWRIATQYRNGLYDTPPKEELKALWEKDRSVCAIVKNIVKKHLGTDMGEMLRRSAPWKDNGREANNGKWNRTIPDGQIWSWQKKRL